MLHVIYNLILIFGLWTLASGVQEKSFSDLCWGLVGLAMGFGFLIDSNQGARRFGVEGKSFRMDGSFYVPEHAARLGLFAACLAIAAIATVLLVRDERIRLVCFLTTMVVGLVGTKVLPLKALKWLLSTISLNKLKADE